MRRTLDSYRMRPLRHMRSIRARAISLCVVLVALFAAAPGTANAAGCANADAMPRAVSERVLGKAAVCLVNKERRRHGMRALRINRRLSRAALSHTVDMVNKRYFEHTSKTGLDVVDRLNLTGYLGRASSWLVGENLAWGTEQLSTPRQTLVAWMKSPGHRANILKRRFREIGIGVVFHAPSSTASRVAATYTTTFGYRR